MEMPENTLFRSNTLIGQIACFLFLYIRWCLIVKHLLMEYKSTLKNTKSLLQYTNHWISIANKKRNLEQIELLEREAALYRAEISDLNFIIKWIRTGRQPGSTRGVENRAAYEREIPVDPYWIQLNNDTAYDMYKDTNYENTDFEKEELIKKIIKPLNKKEKEIFIMAANDMSIRQIAKMTGIPRSTVHDTLKKCSQKIEEGGWFRP